MNNILKKGSKVYLEGALQTRKWQDQSGQDKYTTEVVLQNFGGTLVMLDARQGGGMSEGGQSYGGNDQFQGSSGQGGQGGQSNQGAPGGSSAPSAPSGGSFEKELDDEIPF